MKLFDEIFKWANEAVIDYNYDFQSKSNVVSLSTNLQKMGLKFTNYLNKFSYLYFNFSL